MGKVHWDLGYLPIFIFEKGLGSEGVDCWAGKGGGEG